MGAGSSGSTALPMATQQTGEHRALSAGVHCNHPLKSRGLNFEAAQQALTASLTRKLSMTFLLTAMLRADKEAKLVPRQHPP